MPEKYSIKIENETARFYRKDGEFVRVICAGALGAEIKDDEVIIQMQGGKKKIFSIRGFFKRNA